MNRINGAYLRVTAWWKRLPKAVRFILFYCYLPVMLIMTMVGICILAPIIALMDAWEEFK